VLDIQFKSISYFTNIAVQNVNKTFVYITEFTASLRLISPKIIKNHYTMLLNILVRSQLKQIIFTGSWLNIFTFGCHRLQVNYVKRSSFDFVTHLEFSSLAFQIWKTLCKSFEGICNVPIGWCNIPMQKNFILNIPNFLL
jgi:hypothetical protein